MKRDATILKSAGAIGVVATVVAFFAYDPPPSDLASPTASIGRLRALPASPAERRRLVDEYTAELVTSPLEWPSHWRELGRIFAREDDPAAAVEQWVARAPRSLVEDHRGDAFLWYWMAWWADERSAADTAAERWRRAIDIILAHMQARPDDVTILHWHTLAWSRHKTGDAAGAADALHSLLAMLASRGDALTPHTRAQRYISAAEVWFQLERPADSALAVRDAAAIVNEHGEFPNLNATWPALANYFMRVDRAPEAAACLARASRDLAESPQTRRSSWIGLLDLAKELDRRPSDENTTTAPPPPPLDRSTALVTCARAVAAIDSSNDAPGAAAWDTLARIARALDDPAGAREMWRRALAAHEAVMARQVVSLSGPLFPGVGTAEADRAASALYDLACYRALVGDAPGALAALDQAVGAGYRDADFAGADPDLASIHADPALTALQARMRANFAAVAARTTPDLVPID